MNVYVDSDIDSYMEPHNYRTCFVQGKLTPNSKVFITCLNGDIALQVKAHVDSGGPMADVIIPREIRAGNARADEATSRGMRSIPPRSGPSYPFARSGQAST